MQQTQRRPIQHAASSNLGTTYHQHRAMSPSTSGSGMSETRQQSQRVNGGGDGSGSGSYQYQTLSADSTIAPRRREDDRSGASSSNGYASNEEAFWDAPQNMSQNPSGSGGRNGNTGAYGGYSTSGTGMYAQPNVSAPHVDAPGSKMSRGPPLADDLNFDKLSIHARDQGVCTGATGNKQLPSGADQRTDSSSSFANREIYRSAAEVHPDNSLRAIADEVDHAAEGFASQRRGSAFSSGGTSSTAHQRAASRGPQQSSDYYRQNTDYAHQGHATYQQYPGNYSQIPPETGYPESQLQRQHSMQSNYDRGMYQGAPGAGSGWYGPDGVYYDESQATPQQYGYETFAHAPAHHQQQQSGYFGGSPSLGTNPSGGQFEGAPGPGGGPLYMTPSNNGYDVNYPGPSSSQIGFGMYGAPPSIGPNAPVPAGYGLHRQSTGLSVASGRSSASAAARRRSKDAAAKQTQQSLPFNKAFVDEYRQRMKGDPDPEAQFAYARYLIEAAKKVSDPRDGAKQARKYRDALLSESLKLIKRLATTGMGLGKPPYAEAQFFLANCFGNGSLGLQVDHEKAYNLYVQASKQNHAAATYRTAVCNEVGAGTRRDHHRAVLFYRKASALGDTAGMYKLGMILLNGLLGQPRNIREAIVWLKRAAGQADEDNPHALHELGLLHEKPNNNVVPVDEAYARELFTQAAQLGYAPSQFKLGSAYEYGSLTCPVDPRRSIAWYTKAAGKSDGESELALSGWYLTGSEGVLKQSDSEAYLWARRAATKGIPKAEYAVGYYSEVGIGVEANVEEAKRWYMRAAAQGNKRAMLRLTELKQQRSMGRNGKKGARPTRKDAERECTIM